jgi:DNA modification methylase
VKPYYADDHVVLYHARWEDVPPDLLRADVLVTDPPYGIGRDGQKQTTGGNGGRKAYPFMGWDADRPSRSSFDRLLSGVCYAVIWGGNYFADLLPPTAGWLVWDKGQRINQSDGELAWTSEQGALRIFTQNRVALMTDGAVHPTQKPVALMRWVIEKCPPGTILDPYAGSGTTLVAAKSLNRKAIGVECVEAYCEVAAKRLSQEVLGLVA